MKTQVEVVRRGLDLLNEEVTRKHLREASKEASIKTRAALKSELTQVDHLSDENLRD